MLFVLKNRQRSARRSALARARTYRVGKLPEVPNDGGEFAGNVVVGSRKNIACGGEAQTEIIKSYDGTLRAGGPEAKENRSETPLCRCSGTPLDTARVYSGRASLYSIFPLRFVFWTVFTFSVLRFVEKAVAASTQIRENKKKTTKFV